MKFITLMFAATVLQGLAMRGRADDPAVRQQLKWEYMKCVEAFKTKDLRGLMYRYTLDFKRKVSDGHVWKRSDVEENAGTQLYTVRQVKELSYTIQTLTVNGDHAVATVKVKASLVYQIGDKLRTVDTDQTTEDTWTKTEKGWRLKFQDVLSTTTTEDGKRVTRISSLFGPLYMGDRRAA